MVRKEEVCSPPRSLETGGAACQESHTGKHRVRQDTQGARGKANDGIVISRGGNLLQGKQAWDG